MEATTASHLRAVPTILGTPQVTDVVRSWLKRRNERPDEPVLGSRRQLKDEAIKSAGSKTVLYMTWARKNAAESQRPITDAYELIGREMGATVVRTFRDYGQSAFDRDDPDDRPDYAYEEGVTLQVYEFTDGGRYSLEDLRGKAVVLNFWGPNCIPCRDEFPQIRLGAWHRWSATDRQRGGRNGVSGGVAEGGADRATRPIVTKIIDVAAGTYKHTVIDLPRSDGAVLDDNYTAVAVFVGDGGAAGRSAPSPVQPDVTRARRIAPTSTLCLTAPVCMAVRFTQRSHINAAYASTRNLALDT